MIIIITYNLQSPEVLKISLNVVLEKQTNNHKKAFFQTNPPFIWGEFKLLHFLAVMLWYSFAGNKAGEIDTKGERTTKVFIVDADF